MTKKKKINLTSIFWAFIAIGILLLGSGCATNRGVLDVKIDVPENPVSDKAVSIVRVTDIRQFEVAPRDASVPSLRGDGTNDPALKARAIARKRNGYGKALGDIVLPEGRSIEDLAREALTKAFIEAGYKVIDDGSTYEGKIIPIEADIEQFWSWFTPGFWSVALQFEAKIKIKGDIMHFEEGETVRGHVKLHTQAAGTRAWLKTINKGIENLIEEIKNRLEM
jgi:hypothetical protein